MSIKEQTKNICYHSKAWKLFVVLQNPFLKIEESGFLNK